MSTDGQHAIIRVLDAIDVVFNKDFVILEVNNFLWAYYILIFKEDFVISGQVHQ
jgi:hypothetical protein